MSEVNPNPNNQKSWPIDRWVPCVGSGESLAQLHFLRLFRSAKALWTRGCPHCGVSKTFFGMEWETRKSYTLADLKKQIKLFSGELIVSENSIVVAWPLMYYGLGVWGVPPEQPREEHAELRATEKSV